ncbi:MAG: DUF3018 family protein [Proteobacteria bacterium]|nr:DUF3018 family protein [Pseudomonadota bacterium]MBI3499317.1 DUF3018 family protein [Pseudomonadota bacterium]
MRAMRGRRRKRGMREVRLHLPDPRIGAVRRRIAMQVRRLNQADEQETLAWIEAVSEFDENASR